MTVKVNYTIKGTLTLTESEVKDILNLAELPETLSEDQLSELTEFELSDDTGSMIDDASTNGNFEAQVVVT